MSGRDSFSSRWGLIFAAAGSAIGLGNIWLFPYLVGEHGGAAFIIPYVVCLAVLGIIAVIGEVTLGRLTGTGPVGAFKKALELRGKNGKMGELFGWVCILVNLVQTISYILVVSWIVRFLLASFTGSALNSVDSTKYFDNVISNHVFLWVTVTVFVTAITILRGVEKGIEKICKLMIPAVIVLLLVISIRVVFLPRALEGYKYLFNPNWKFLFDVKTWMLALGQVFYSLSLRGSTMVVYGSYVKKTEDLIFSAKNIVVLDTLASIVAALLIIPAVFAFGKDLNKGPALMFVTMPDIFKNLPFGQVLMGVFFTAVFFAALTSLVGMFEVLVEVLQNKLKMFRFLAVGLVSLLTVFLCEIFVVGNLKEVINILLLYLIPLCALGSSIFVFWVVPKHIVLQEIQSGHHEPVGTWLIQAGRYVLCGIIILIFILHLK
jgi:NSS family neurotransmitter:Na+ symporter